MSELDPLGLDLETIAIVDAYKATLKDEGFIESIRAITGEEATVGAKAALTIEVFFAKGEPPYHSVKGTVTNAARILRFDLDLRRRNNEMQNGELNAGLEIIDRLRRVLTSDLIYDPDWPETGENMLDKVKGIDLLTDLFRATYDVLEAGN